MTAATATAHPNIALIKYWGKADEALSLPATGSLSMTLDILPTTTTVALIDDPADEVRLNEIDLDPGSDASVRVTRFLDLVRDLAGDDRRAQVVSKNTAPTAAGLASSASGFAALAVAAAAAYGIPLDARDLSRLARRGSGSASRSIVPGVAVWHAGRNAESFAEPVPAPEMAMVVATVHAGEKRISSRAGMRRTVETSPFFPAWVTSTAQSLDDMLAACAAGDFTRIGELTESNALRMHASALGAVPPVRYLSPASLAVFDAIEQLRADGIPAYGTADAGPNVVALCLPEDRDAVAARLGELAPVLVAGPGPGAALVDANTQVTA